MLGIIIGNASVITMIGIGQGAQKYTLEKLESFGGNRLMVFQGSNNSEGFTATERTLVLSDAEAIQTQAPAVRQVAPEIQSSLLISYRSRRASTSVIGVTPGFLEVKNFTIARGRFFDLSQQQQNAQVVVLGSEVVRELFNSEDPLGKEVDIKNISFQVIGVMATKGSSGANNEDDAVYVPITTMASQISGKQSPYGIPIDSLQVSAQDKQSIRAAAFQITNLLTRLHGKKDFIVLSDKSFQNLVNQVTGMLTLMLAAIASISLLVGGIGIMNIMLVSVTERTQEIGLRKAIGATQTDILSQFLIEAVILSALGGLIGIFVGISGSSDYIDGKLLLKAYDQGNSDSTIDYLRYLLAESADQRLLIFWDGATYHRSQDVRAFLDSMNQGLSTEQWKIHCVRFAPNCPEQNPIEDIWLQAKTWVRRFCALIPSFSHLKWMFEWFIRHTTFDFPTLQMYGAYSKIK